MNAFENTLEGRMTSGNAHRNLELLYGKMPETQKAVLDRLPECSFDYITRYTFWAQNMQKLTPKAQYEVMHQLVRAYALFAVGVQQLRDVPTEQAAHLVYDASAHVPCPQ